MKDERHRYLRMFLAALDHSPYPVCRENALQFLRNRRMTVEEARRIVAEADAEDPSHRLEPVGTGEDAGVAKVNPPVAGKDEPVGTGGTVVPMRKS